MRHNLKAWSWQDSSSLACRGSLKSFSLIDCDPQRGARDERNDDDEGPAARGSFNNDNVISKVAQGLPSLVVLDLAGTGYPSNHGCKLVESFLPYLESLCLSGAGSASQCGACVTDRGLAAVAAGCVGLRRFTLTQAAKITDQGILVWHPARCLRDTGTMHSLDHQDCNNKPKLQVPHTTKKREYRHDTLEKIPPRQLL